MRCRVMASEDERMAAHSVRREVQQRKLRCWECKEENHVARNCNSYWRRRKQELKRKLKELKEKVKGEERVVRHTIRPLRAVWIKIGIEKTDTHEGVIVKALLDSGATEMFVNKKFIEEHGFRLDKLEKPVIVTNVDGSRNSGRNITYEVECNVYYRGHQERMKFNMCNLGKTEVILGMPWLAANNPEIDWEKGEVKMMRCLPWCGKDNRSKKVRERQEQVKGREMRKVEEEKAISWVADEKEDWRREEEMEIDHQKIETMVPKRFY